MEPFQGYNFDHKDLMGITDTVDDIPTLYTKYNNPETACKVLFNIKIKYISTNEKVRDEFYKQCDVLAFNLIENSRELGDMWRVIYFMYQQEYIYPATNDIGILASNTYFNEPIWAICNLLAKQHYTKNKKLIEYLHHYNVILKIRGDPCYDLYTKSYRYASSRILTQDIMDNTIVTSPSYIKTDKSLKRVKSQPSLHNSHSVFFW